MNFRSILSGILRQLSRYTTWHLTMSFFCYFWASLGEQSRYCVGRYAVRKIDILYAVSRCIISIFLVRSASDYYEILPSFSRLIFSTILGRRAVNYLDRRFCFTVSYVDILFGLLTTNILDIYSNVLLGIFTIFCRVSRDELFRYVVQRLTVKFPVLTGVPWRFSLSIFCQALAVNLSDRLGRSLGLRFSVYWVQSGRRVMSTTHLHLGLRLRVSGAEHLLIRTT
jgi:hypothetical protein